MVRIFPRATRRRVVAALAAGSMLFGAAAAPLASADDLKDRKHRVQGHIKKAERHLDQSSGRLAGATRALEGARERLRTAERELAQATGKLEVAELVDDRMQAALDDAVRDLQRARANLAHGTTAVREQQRVLGQIAAQSYQLGGPTMIGLSMVLTSTDPSELTSQLNSVKNVLDKESVTVDRLNASTVLLAVQEVRVETAKDAVAVRRQDAAENLERRETLAAAAQEAEEKVTGLVTERAKARHAAAKAKAADAKQVRQLKKERAKISKLLKERARAARRRAVARADHGGRAEGFLSYPVRSYITSGYGMRLHPVYHRWTLHDGTDFGARCGTPVRAAASGTVIARYYNAGYGNRVIMYNGWRAGAGLGTSYNHLSGYSTHVGQRVKRGDVIGFAGTTGFSTGCHLHFMVFRNGATANPMKWL